MGKISDALKETGVKQTSIGGQAVMEGVMMRGQKIYAVAVRKPDDDIEIVTRRLTPVSEKLSVLKLPVIRGIVSFISSLVLGFKIISVSADLAMGETNEAEELSGFDRFLQRTFGDKLNDIIIFISVCLAIVLSITLFMLLPVGIGYLFNPLINGNTFILSVIEGIVRLCVFLAYILLIARSKEIKRVFQYHGAEHKTINCFEHQEALTVENVKKYSRLHKRCGTSFLLIVMLMAMLVFMFIRTDDVFIRLISRVALVPIIAGLSYEIIKWAGRNNNFFVNLISYPGMCLQKVTTAEPDDGMIETAIAAMNTVVNFETDQQKPD
jgi:uncharacterized protein YqhQ